MTTDTTTHKDAQTVQGEQCSPTRARGRLGAKPSVTTHDTPHDTPLGALLPNNTALLSPRMIRRAGITAVLSYNAIALLTTLLEHR